MVSLAHRFTARVRQKWTAMRSRVAHPAASQRKMTGGTMTKEQVRHAIETLFLDAMRAYQQALGDGRDDRDDLQAQLSRQFTERLMLDLDAYQREIIGEDEPIEAVYQAWYEGKYPEPVY